MREAVHVCGRVHDGVISGMAKNIPVKYESFDRRYN